jgi:hypothetical protein
MDDKKKTVLSNFLTLRAGKCFFAQKTDTRHVQTPDIQGIIGLPPPQRRCRALITRTQ